MVQPKNKPSFLDELQRARESRGKVIDHRYFVCEITPGYNTGGYYDQDVPKRVVRVSPFFSDEHAAVEWMDNHIPDEGKRLQVFTQSLYERVIKTWI